MTAAVPLGGPRIRRIQRAVGPLLVRGEHFDVNVDLMQCTDFLRRFPHWGRYGISAYEAANTAEIDRIASEHLERFAMLSVFRSSSLEAAGFEIVPTFRSPHVTVAFTGDVDDHLRELATLRVEVRRNPYHR